MTRPPNAGRVIGVDLGAKRIGIALSDPSRVIASPLVVLSRPKGNAGLHRALRDLIDEWEATLIVVGLPLSLSGRDGPAAKAARVEVAAMQMHFGDEIPVVLHDERLTTTEAQRSLAEAGLRGRDQTPVVDKVAAAVMLQAFLDGGGAR